jgi:hypothetical protein
LLARGIAWTLQEQVDGGNWHGRTHHVLVVDGGYSYRERHYRSLTAIAREITGVAWSGPRFFGLVGKRVSTDAA